MTDTWKERGAKDKGYAILTDEIYKSTFNMNTAQYKELKGINKTKRKQQMTKKLDSKQKNLEILQG